MHEATAWIVELGHGLRAALASAELVHLLPVPTLFELPQAPPYCRHLMVWEREILPVLDLAHWLAGSPAARGGQFIGVVGYQEQSEENPGRAALFMDAIPIRVKVKDEQACDLPPHPSGWRYIACACFLHESQAVPVLDLPFLFSSAAALGDRIEAAAYHGWGTEGWCRTSSAAAGRTGHKRSTAVRAEGICHAMQGQRDDNAND
jgi:chemotaxis signal transduction protein